MRSTTLSVPFAVPTARHIIGHRRKKKRIGIYSGGSGTIVAVLRFVISGTAHKGTKQMQVKDAARVRPAQLPASPLLLSGPSRVGGLQRHRDTGLRHAPRDLDTSGLAQRTINPDVLSCSREHQSTIKALRSANEELRTLNTKLEDTLERYRSEKDGPKSFPCGTEAESLCLLVCLTPRQRQIMGMVLDGHPSKNIAADLKISRRTVENHRASIMLKTGAKSLPALVRLALAASNAAAGLPRHRDQ
jgi:DNA-binding CsgD family transcriptional regulator